MKVVKTKYIYIYKFMFVNSVLFWYLHHSPKEATELASKGPKLQRGLKLEAFRVQSFISPWDCKNVSDLFQIPIFDQVCHAGQRKQSHDENMPKDVNMAGAKYALFVLAQQHAGPTAITRRNQHSRSAQRVWPWSCARNLWGPWVANLGLNRMHVFNRLQ